MKITLNEAIKNYYELSELASNELNLMSYFGLFSIHLWHLNMWAIPFFVASIILNFLNHDFAAGVYGRFLRKLEDDDNDNDNDNNEEIENEFDFSWTSKLCRIKNWAFIIGLILLFF